MFVKKILPVAFLTLLVLAFLLPSVSWGASRKNVLVLHNFHQDHPAIAEFDQGLRDILLQNDRYDIRISSEHLDLASFQKVDAYIPDAASYLVMKYSILRPDVVIVDRALLPMYNAYLLDIFKNVPVILADEGSLAKKTDASPNVTTVPRGVSNADIEKNIDLILRLRPNTRTVYVILGTSIQERVIAQQVDTVTGKYVGKVSFVCTNTLSHADMLQAVAGASGESAILFIRFARDALGESYVPARVLREICRTAAVPVFTIVRHLLGDGVVGGYVYDMNVFGRQTAQLAVDLLDRKTTPQAGVLEGGGAQYVFDWRELKRWHIPEIDLPAENRVVFKEDSLWETHRGLIVGGVALLIAETFLILGLVVNRLRRMRAESALVALNASLEARVMERTRELHESNEQLHETKEQLEALNASLERISRTDSLTGLANRRHVEALVDEQFRILSRYGTSFSVALLDVDFFKNINDVYGHEAGDGVLGQLALEMLGQARSCDTVARWGGEEFLLVLPQTGGEAAFSLVERLRRRIEAARYACGETAVSVTVTLGIATARPGDAREDVVRRADAALYQGKAAGRNRVVSG